MGKVKDEMIKKIDKVLDDCVYECNDGPTPWCLDKNSSKPYQFRKRILKIFKEYKNV